MAFTAEIQALPMAPARSHPARPLEHMPDGAETRHRIPLAKGGYNVCGDYIGPAGHVHVQVVGPAGDLAVNRPDKYTINAAACCAPLPGLRKRDRHRLFLGAATVNQFRDVGTDRLLRATFRERHGVTPSSCRRR